MNVIMKLSFGLPNLVFCANHSLQPIFRIKRWLLQFFVLILIVSGIYVLPAASQSIDFNKNPENIGGWLTYYYKNKSPEYVPAALKYLQDSSLLDKNPNAIDPIVGFFGVVFIENPDKVEVWVKSTKFTQNMREAIREALWVSNNSEIDRLVFSDLAPYSKPKERELLERQIRTSGDMDNMWGAFFASGDTRYIGKLVNMLDPSTKLSDDSKYNDVLRKVARWSLGSNAKQHKYVKNYLVDLSTTTKGVVQTELFNILEVNFNNSFPKSNGDFSADLIIIREKSLEEFLKSSDQGLHLVEFSNAQIGDIAAIKIVFFGMSLDKDKNADVTYDIQILDPSGEIYSKTDYKDLIAIRSKIDSNYGVFDNAEIIMIRFEEQDMLGPYKVSVKIKDNIGKKAIDLIKSITLEK